MNEALPKLLRAIAGSADAKHVGHDVIFNAAADELESLRASKEQLRSALADMVVEYVTARKEGNVAGLPATAQAIVRRAEACFEPNPK
jgi:hypothetical protein